MKVNMQRSQTMAWSRLILDLSWPVSCKQVEIEF